jgi:hypothetical protein
VAVAGVEHALLDRGADALGERRAAAAIGDARDDQELVAAPAEPDARLSIAGVIAIERATNGAASTLTSWRRADALRGLLGEDSDAATLLTPDAARRLVQFVQQIACLRLVVGDEAEAAGCILRACASPSA